MRTIRKVRKTGKLTKVDTELSWGDGFGIMDCCGGILGIENREDGFLGGSLITWDGTPICCRPGEGSLGPMSRENLVKIRDAIDRILGE